MHSQAGRINSQAFKGKHVVVVGLGVSGFHAARWLKGAGARVTVSEAAAEKELDSDRLGRMEALGVTLETGGHRRETFLKAEAIVLSPGVPHHLPLLGPVRQRGVPVLGELELAGRIITTPIIAVTGTNGKSTVTALLGELVRHAGLKVFVGGNIGTPLMAYAEGAQGADYVVAEVSSFQLDTSETFCPQVSVILNISPDHLDRYPDYDAYVRSKLRLLRNQGPGHWAVLNDDDTLLSGIQLPPGITVLRYGTEKKRGRHAYVEGEAIHAGRGSDVRHTLPLEAIQLPGRHNQENVMAAVLAGLALGIEAPVIRQGVEAFRGLPHRLEKVGERGGTAFYNDSKATNIDAAVRALGSFQGPVILIAGGRHKGADYGPLVQAAEGRVKHAVLLGEARGRLAAAFRESISCTGVADMEEAVSVAFSKADAGDTVLLAPACASFDMFTDYAHRGRAFREAVEGLIHGR
jgi:UDP-N-acetylmuramoylalanine--D-glutamate ligase